MGPTTYEITFTDENAPYDFKGVLRGTLPGTCWDGHRVAGGWREQLGVDRLLPRDYVLTAWSGHLAEPMQVGLFKDRVAKDYGSDIADAVEREIKSRT